MSSSDSHDNHGVTSVFGGQTPPSIESSATGDGIKYTCITDDWLFKLTGSRPLIIFIKDYQSSRRWFNLNFFLVLICAMHMFYCWRKILDFLHWYYIERNNPSLQIIEEETAREFSPLGLWIIAGSYFVIDAIYPLAFWLLVDLFRKDLLKIETTKMVTECGVTQYEKFKRDVAYDHAWHIGYGVLHCILLYWWLGYIRYYPASDVFFWSGLFGIPHALNPLYLTIAITRIFKCSLYRVRQYRQDVVRHEYKEDVDTMLNMFVHIRNDVNKLTRDMEGTISWFLGSLFLAIFGQLFSYFVVFGGDPYNAIYLLLNVWCLVWVFRGAQEVTEEFRLTVDDIIQSGTSSALGALDYKARIGFIKSIQALSIPMFKIGTISLSTRDTITRRALIFILIYIILGTAWEAFKFSNRRFYSRPIETSPAEVAVIITTLLMVAYTVSTGDTIIEGALIFYLIITILGFVWEVFELGLLLRYCVETLVKIISPSSRLVDEITVIISSLLVVACALIIAWVMHKVNQWAAKKKQAQEAAVSRTKLISEKIDEIGDMQQLLLRVGFTAAYDTRGFAETLVIDHNIESDKKFERIVGVDIAGYSKVLQLDESGVNILTNYFSSQTGSINTEATTSIGGQPSSPATSPLQYSGNKITFNELDYLEVIGRGANSVVIKAKYGRHTVAVKILKDLFPLETLRELAINELMVIHNAKAKVIRDIIIQAVGLCEGVLPGVLNKFNIPSGIPGCGIILMYEGGGSLESVLYGTPFKPKTKFFLEERIRILTQIASGLDELHTVGILHGDIKPANVLLSDHQLVRLADFGQAEEIVQPISMNTTLRPTVSTDRKGTLVYTAPECLPSSHASTISKISRRTDVYSFAILAWEALNKTGKRPYADITNCDDLIPHVTVNDSRPSLDDLVDDVPPAVRHMIQRCWDKNRARRDTALDCYNILDQAYNTLSQAKFDIFLSHPWRNKNVLRYVKKFLNSYGYRVWYDENEMGWDLSKSMKDGIENSQIVLVCLNKLYLSRENCMFELIESCRINKNIVTLATEPDPFAWAGSNTTHGNAYDLCQLSTKMFIDIGKLYAKPGWPAENDPPDTPVPDELMEELKDKISELVRYIQGDPFHCKPSLPPI